jgi:hypothetical protein
MVVIFNNVNNIVRVVLEFIMRAIFKKCSYHKTMFIVISLQIE